MLAAMDHQLLISLNSFFVMAEPIIKIKKNARLLKGINKVNKLFLFIFSSN